MFLILTLCSEAMAKDTERFVFTGDAFDETGSELYRERHTVVGICRGGQFQPKDHQTDYIDGSNEKPFAHKQLTYSRSLLRPELNFVQPRFKENLSVSYAEAGIVIKWRSPSEGLELYNLDVSNGLVVDSGFNNLVRQNWAAVIAGRAVSFDFLAPTLGDYYRFVIEPAHSDNIQADHLIRIRPLSLVLRFMVDPIILGYNEQGALTHYSGLTNIRQDEQHNYHADILYSITEYPSCSLLSETQRP